MTTLEEFDAWLAATTLDAVRPHDGEPTFAELRAWLDRLFEGGSDEPDNFGL